MEWLRWAYWRVVYAVRPHPKDLAGYLLLMSRTWPPGRKFESSVFRNDDGSQWEIYLTDERSYTVSGDKLSVNLHIGMESGNVTGLTIWDECLKDVAESVKQREPTNA